MRRVLPILLMCAVAASCGGEEKETATQTSTVVAPKGDRCREGALVPLGDRRRAYAGFAEHGAVAYRRKGGAVLARFGPKNVNDYPTVFGVLGAVVQRDCKPRWYRVELPIKPNGIVGYVRASALRLEAVRARILVDVSERRLTLYENGRVRLRATVAVGSPATPTPTGRYYVNQRLVPEDTTGPFGPGAVGISAFSNVLTGWTQGGPVAIHGTNAPWSIGRAVSNGCIRLPNATLEKVFDAALAGTPVIIRS